MDLKQEKEPRSVPYPIAVMTIIAGGFFLLGVGISAYTLNAVEASATSSNQRLNIAKLADSQTRRSGIMTDLLTYNEDYLDGTLTVEYPAAFIEQDIEATDMVLYTNEDESESLYIMVSQEGENTHIETANAFAEILAPDMEEIDLALLDSGQTSGEELVFGLYTFDVDEDLSYTIAVVDIQEDKVDGGKVRMVIATDSGASLINTLLETINVTK